MKRLTAILGAVVLGCAAVSPVQAATVIASGSFDDFTGDTFAVFASVGPLAPGTYRFTFSATADDFDYFIGDVKKTISDNMYTYLDGLGVVLTGGDDVDQYYLLGGAGPSDLSALVTVNPDHSVPYPQGGHDDFHETCCSFDIEGRATGPGTFTLSYVAVPEPAAWALMVLGVGVAGGRLRSSRRRVSARGSVRDLRSNRLAT